MATAAAAAARSVLRSPAARSAAARLASQPKSARSPFSLPSRTPLAQRLSRSPVEMSACVVSLQPYHTATASALMMSMLTFSRCGFGWLPDASDACRALFCSPPHFVSLVSSYGRRALFCRPPHFVSVVVTIIDAYGSILKGLHTID